jgi:hypothetical protein
VLQRCRPYFASHNDHTAAATEEQVWKEFYAMWHLIVASLDERSFEERLAKFELKYKDKYLDSVRYIKTY